MRRFQYVEPGHNDEPVTITVSEEWIMKMYQPYWRSMMLKAGKDPHDYTKEDVIVDFQIVNWASEI